MLTFLELVDKINFLKKIKDSYERERQFDNPGYTQTCAELTEREKQQASGQYVTAQSSQ